MPETSTNAVVARLHAMLSGLTRPKGPHCNTGQAAAGHGRDGDPITRDVPRPLMDPGAGVRGGLGTIVGATFLGMGIACLETPTFKDLE